MKWLIEPEVFKGELDPFIDALYDFKYHFTLCKFGVPYAKYATAYKPTDCVVVHGSTQFVTTIQNATKWNVFYSDDYAKLDDFEPFLLNKTLHIPFSELVRNQKLLSNFFSKNGCVFIKPAKDFKLFTGHTFSTYYWDDKCKELARRVNPDTLIAICSPANIKREWRLVVADQEIISACQYKENGSIVRIPGCPNEVDAFGKAVIRGSEYQAPHRVWILDICETAEEDLSVLEIGPFACSGLYCCNPEAIIQNVSRIAQEEFNLQIPSVG